MMFHIGIGLAGSAAYLFICGLVDTWRGKLFRSVRPRVQPLRAHATSRQLNLLIRAGTVMRDLRDRCHLTPPQHQRVVDWLHGIDTGEDDMPTRVDQAQAIFAAICQHDATDSRLDGDELEMVESWLLRYRSEEAA